MILKRQFIAVSRRMDKLEYPVIHPTSTEMMFECIVINRIEVCCVQIETMSCDLGCCIIAGRQSSGLGYQLVLLGKGSSGGTANF